MELYDYMKHQHRGLNMMEQIKIYLCGPIHGVSDDSHVTWREQAEGYFGGSYDSIYKPRMGDVDYEEKKKLFKILNPLRRNFRDNELFSQNEIVQLDKADIMNSDILLVNGMKPGWGTAMEVLFGFIHHKIIVTFTGNSLKETSPWLAFHSTRVLKSLDEACEYIMKNFP